MIHLPIYSRSVALVSAMLGLSAVGCNVQARGSNMVLSRADHLVYGTPDLEATINELEEKLGIRATHGGQHPGHGTRNALLALGPATYLEILGPDPEQPDPDRARWLGIDDLIAPRLLTWAAREQDLKRMVSYAAKKGVTLGDILSGSRERPDGVVLSWQLTDPHQIVADGIVPFFIDWGKTPHPAQPAPQGLSLIGMRAEHPQPENVRKRLDHLGLDLPVTAGSAPALIATIRTQGGVVELR